MTETRLVGFKAVASNTPALAVQASASAAPDAGDGFEALLALLGDGAIPGAESPAEGGLPGQVLATGPAATSTSLVALAPQLAAGNAASAPDTAPPEAVPPAAGLAALGQWLQAFMPKLAGDAADPVPLDPQAAPPAPAQTPGAPARDVAAALLAWIAGPGKTDAPAGPDTDPDPAAPESDDDDDTDATDAAVQALPGPPLALPVSAPLAPAAPEAAPALNGTAAKKLEAVAEKLSALAPKLAATDPALGKAVARLAEKLGDPAAAAGLLQELGFPATDSGDLPVPVAQFAAALTDKASTALAVPERQVAMAAPAGAKPVTSAPPGGQSPLDAPVLPASEPEKTEKTETPTAPGKPDSVSVAPHTHHAAAAADASAAVTGGPAPDTKPQPAPALRPVQAAYQQPVAPPAPVQVAFEIAHHVSVGHTKFEMRLDPPDLGRVDVSLTLDKAGNTHAHLIVERAETLDLMQRDQRGLQQALQQAGLDTSRTTMEFQLRQNPFAGDFSGLQQDRRQQGRNPPVTRDSRVATGDEPGDIDTATPVITRRGSLRLGGVNLMV